MVKFCYAIRDFICTLYTIIMDKKMFRIDLIIAKIRYRVCEKGLKYL